jgi:hypothetical protein
LFVEKWSSKNDSDVNTFIAYFDQQWVQKNFNWFEGAHDGIPSTDNALESTNKWIKDCETLRNRLSLSEFNNVAMQCVGNWSKDRNTNEENCDKPFILEPVLSTKIYTLAFQWASSNYKMLAFKPVNNFQDYYFTNDKEKPITAQYVEIYNRKDWSEFDHYVEWLSFISFIHFKKNDWRSSSCSCVHFKKDYICSHLIGLAVRLKIIEVPLEATTVPLGKVRGVGRPSMVASVTCYTGETISSQFQVSSTTALLDTNIGIKRPLILEEEELEEKEDEVEEDEEDVEVVPIPIQNKRRGRPPGSKNKKKD